jgi:sugar lactone lactonase YvrE
MRYFLLLVIFFACSNPGKITVEKKWQTEQILQVPEAVTYDPQRNVMYVSNINGKPLDKDGNGYISIVKLDGNIDNLKWVTGLNAPKGSALDGKNLYVTDIDALVQIDIETGKIIERYSSEEAVFLNDVAIDETGNVYVSDYSGQNSAIYKLSGSEFSIWMKGDDIDRPNGLMLRGNKLLVGNSGDGKIKSVDLKDKTVRVIATVGSGIDGLRMDDEDNFIVSDWAGNTSYVSKDGTITSLINTTEQKINSADIEFIKKMNLLIIPTFFDNRLVAYQLIK